MSRRASDLWNDNQVTIDVGDVIMGNVSIVGPVTMAGNVTISDSKKFIGLTTTVLSESPAFVGIVTVANKDRTITGSATLADAKGYIGLVTVGGIGTVTLADPKGFIGLVSTTGNTNLSTLIAGEDQTNDVLKVEQQFSYATMVANSTVATKSAAGFLHTITVGAMSCPTITVWDNTVPSGTYIHRFMPNTPIATYRFDSKFTTGLSIDALAGVAPQLHISYR